MNSLTDPNDGDKPFESTTQSVDMDDTVVGAPSAEDFRTLGVAAPGTFVRAPTEKPANDSSTVEQTVSIEDVEDEANMTLIGDRAANASGISPIQTMDWTNTGAKPKERVRVVVDKSLGIAGLQYAMPFLEKDGRSQANMERHFKGAPSRSHVEGQSLSVNNDTTANVEVVNDKRLMYIDALRRMADRVRADTGVLSRYTIALKIENANKYWEKFQDAHNDVYASVSTPSGRREASNLHCEIENVHGEILADLHQRLDDCSLNMSMPQLQGDHRRANEVKLKPVSIDPFDGDFEKWPAFKSVFTNYFSQGYTKHAKMIYLRQSLVPGTEAYDLISGLEPSGENYDVAWETLCSTYDDVRRILEKAFCALLDTRSIPTPATRSSLLNLVTRTKNTMEIMSKYGVDTSTWGPALVPIVARKLDPASHSDWCLTRPRKEIPEIDPLLKFVTIRSEGIEEYIRALNVNRNVPNNNFRNNSSSNSGNSGNSQRGNFNNRHSNAPATSANNDASSGSANQSTYITGQQAPGKRRCPDPLCAPDNKHHLYTCPRSSRST